MLTIHCFEHALNFAAQDLIKNIKEGKNTLDKIKQ